MIGTSCPSHKWSAINTCSALTSRELHTVSSALTDWVASCGDRTRWWWWWCVRELMVIYGRFDASCAPLDSVGFDFVVPLHLVHFMDSCGSAAIEDAHSMWRFTWLMQREGEGGGGIEHDHDLWCWCKTATSPVVDHHSPIHRHFISETWNFGHVLLHPKTTHHPICFSYLCVIRSISLRPASYANMCAPHSHLLSIFITFVIQH